MKADLSKDKDYSVKALKLKEPKTVARWAVLFECALLLNGFCRECGPDEKAR